MENPFKELYCLQPAELNWLHLHGFKTPKEFNHLEKTHLGKVEFEGRGTVEIWCEMAPATFWIFKIYSIDADKTYLIETGSGELQKYWAQVESFLDGMLDVEVLENTKKK